MNHLDLCELHYIAAIANVPSIMAHGILSHKLAERYHHCSVAMPEVQAIRANRAVPGGKGLHEYANLYLCARNPMLYKRRGSHATLCVLRVSTGVLDLPGVVLTDGNAASDYTAFMPSPSGLAKIESWLVFAEYWTDPDAITAWRKKSAKCAEVLVPDRVPPASIEGVYVSGDEGKRALEALGTGLSVTVDAHLFFA